MNMIPVTINDLRAIVREKAYLTLKVDLEKHDNEEDRCNQILDMQTANMLLTVYDALTKPELRQRFRCYLKENILKLIEMCWKIIK